MATLAETSKVKNSNRISFSPAIEAWVETDVQVLGQNIAAFTETALAKKAQSVLAEQERLVLSKVIRAFCRNPRRHGATHLGPRASYEQLSSQ